jgi:hypothetical protein
MYNETMTLIDGVMMEAAELTPKGMETQDVVILLALSKLIGKYLSSLRKLDHIIAPKAGFEAQL